MNETQLKKRLHGIAFAEDQGTLLAIDAKTAASNLKKARKLVTEASRKRSGDAEEEIEQTDLLEEAYDLLLEIPVVAIDSPPEMPYAGDVEVLRTKAQYGRMLDMMWRAIHVFERAARSSQVR